MKKITLLIALCFISLQSNAQVLLSEGFDSSLTWPVVHTVGTATDGGWSRVTAGTTPTCAPFSGAGMARFYAYNIASGNSYSMTSPAMTFTAGTAYRVKFNMYRDGAYPTDNDRLRVFYNTTQGSAGGNLLGIINRSIALSPVVPADGWYSYSYTIPAAASGTGYISFLASSAYGNNIFIDNVVVSQILQDDAEMSSLDLAAISATQGNTTVTGTIKNFGANAITSLDLNWQVDNGDIHTQNLTGLNIAPAAVYAYSHADQWNAQPGQYSMKVWVSNVNGNTDNDVTNNEITKTLAIASNSTTRLPLYEKFSSSTCNPCATFNGTYFNGFFATHHDELALINYQVNWPGVGDPYYTLETGQRVVFYGVNAAPTLFVDSKDGTNFSTALLASDLAAEAVKPAFFGVNATHTLIGNDINVNVDITPYLTGSYTLRVAVVEKVTTGNIASNGETEFHNVMMKMLPNPAGTVLNTVYDVPQNVQLSATLTNLNIEEMTDLSVVVFVQNNADKTIMQSGYSIDNTLANTQFKASDAIKMFPNPTTGIVRVNTDTPVDVIVTDITGKVILSAKQVTKDTNLNLSAFQKGMYLAKIINGDSEQTQKIILK